jgi:hypothetical protein
MAIIQQQFIFGRFIVRNALCDPVPATDLAEFAEMLASRPVLAQMFGAGLRMRGFLREATQIAWLLTAEKAGRNASPDAPHR